MGMFDFLMGPDINQGVTEFEATPGAALLDVRTWEEYAGGALSNSRNLPLQELDTIAGLVPDRNTPLFVYCYSGSRSSQAVSVLRRMGYQSVKNIGGIIRFRGKVVR